MRVGCYLCRCGSGREGQISECIDPEELAARLTAHPDVAYVTHVDIACGEAGQEQIAEDIRRNRPDRVVVAACSPREHGVTFQRVMRQAELNPYLMHLANIREHVVWVTPDPAEALAKAEAQIRAGVARVSHQQPLTVTERQICADVLVVGAGPAGHKAALTLAEAGRHVVLVERSPILGGNPVRVEDLFPEMECAPCLMEPVTGAILHSEFPGSIEVMLTSSLADVKGSFGNFTVTVRREPRYVSTSECVGCGECLMACPAAGPNPLTLGRTERRAIDFELFGGLPNVPVLDPGLCGRFTPVDGVDVDCTVCRESCPVDGVIDFDDQERTEERQVGAIIVAVGSQEYELAGVEGLGFGSHPDVLSSWQFERLLAANGPTAGELLTSDGREAKNIALVYCAGSLDTEHVPYCSGICCRTALKFRHLIATKHPESQVTCYHRELVAPGKDALEMLAHGPSGDSGTRWVRYERPGDVRVHTEGTLAVEHTGRDGAGDRQEVDLVVLMAPVVPGPAVRELASILDVGLHPSGFFQELNGRTDATRSTTRGIYLAGACQAPMDLSTAMTQGVAAAGQVLASLVENRALTLDPVVAEVDSGRCSGCLSCLLVCPYRAITVTPQGRADVDPALCLGCGTCVVACPVGAMTGMHFTDEALFAEIQEVLR